LQNKTTCSDREPPIELVTELNKERYSGSKAYKPIIKQQISQQNSADKEGISHQS
jgi:hypothetical protein